MLKRLALLFFIFFSKLCISQTKWHPFMGAHVSMDGEGVYFGPSFQVGTDYILKNKKSLVCYFHLFNDRINTNSADGSFENGKYFSAALALLFQAQLSKKDNKGFLLAGGVALQKTSDNYISDILEIHKKRLIVVGAIRIGYAFPMGRNSLSIELNGLGPHHSTEDDPPYSTDIIELLTQLSFGARIIF